MRFHKPMPPKKSDADEEDDSDHAVMFIARYRGDADAIWGGHNLAV
ncbi:hypothetical protein F6B93_04205 [Mycobacterium spongiae]|uniref:Uncharacterized protein n=1 Tax=Mycobacterium spongiae TaxID=886343 RepID=A0A975JVF4_9MYCO|nr:hypothetical protein [Mycobacterium spongiae]QUR66396.1 hypothetical protein F6B93_04205 [Mycobacterium spongiae]